MSWQWWISQAILCVVVAITVISMQQNKSTKIIWWYSFGTLLCLIAMCFLGELSAIFICIAGMIRNVTSLYFAYKMNTKVIVKWIVSVFIVILLVVLNIVFWKDWTSVLAILVGVSLVVAYVQKNPKAIRATMIFVGVISIVYYAIIISPMNIVNDSLRLISTIVAIWRYDILKDKERTEFD